MQFKDKTFIVTGGASGLGAATTAAFIERGARVIVADVKGEAPEGATFVQTDVTNEDSVQALVDQANADGTLAGVVNCAGIGVAQKTVGKQGAHDLGDFTKVIQVNLIGTFNVIRLAAAAMQTNEPGEDGERGVIINTASVAAFEGQMGQAAYSASKGGVAAMTLPAARDLAQHGIRVMCIAPGIISTPMLHNSLTDTVRNALIGMIQFPKRLGDAGDFGALARDIVQNPYLNADVIRLDAGMRLQAR